MKKIFIIALAVVLSLAFTSMAFAGVSASKHDLSSGAGGTGVFGVDTTQICVFCHHPHRGNSTISTILLWNIDSFSSTSYDTYTNGSGTMNATDLGTAVDASVGAQSYLCMACHDGSVAADSLIASPDNGILNNVSYNTGATANLGVTFEDDHPVNFTYDATLAGADSNLATPALGVVTGTTNTYPLYNDQMQCATCHDVHAGDDSKSADINFMRGNTVGSEICIDCHTNK